MITRFKASALFAAALLVLVALPAPAAAAPASPAWKLHLLSLPSSLAPGGEGDVQLLATNVGGAPTDGTAVQLQVTLPEGLQALAVHGVKAPGSAGEAPLCAVAAQTVSCGTQQAIVPGDYFYMTVTFSLAPSVGPGLLPLNASALGGGASGAPTDSQLRVSPNPLSEPISGFLGPLSAPLTNPDGSPATQAGAHPYQYTVEFNFPTYLLDKGGAGANLLKIADPPRTVITSLPPGLIANPAATPVLCTEAEFLSGDAPGRSEGCPPASQLGLLSLYTAVAGAEGIVPITSPLYNMVPPPGAPAALAFDAGGVGIKVHLIAGVRSDSDYSLYTEVEDAPALNLHPFIGVQAQIWGDPSSPAHDLIRGDRLFEVGNGGEPCLTFGLSCPVPAQSTAFLTDPGHCTGQPDVTHVDASTWGAPQTFTDAAYESADLQGNPVSTSGCNALEFAPTLEVRPSTALADSPAGLDVDLHQPQDLDKEHTATAELKDATVTLPRGLVANPSQADGLAACSEAQIGYLGDGHYSKVPQSCPAASKLGTMEVTTPLVAQYTEEGTKLATDPETGKAIPRPLQGSVFLAKPYENQFASLLAIYLAIEDPKTGTIAKLAGKVEPDPQTGQLTTVFEENPQLPLEDVRLHLFGGARASLTTPQTCAAHTTTSDLVPWSSPEGLDAHPESSFQTTAEPGGGSCPGTEGAAANKPAFTAGTIAPVAGAYSPFVLKLSREDGSQRIAGIDTTLPPGLTGKLAGIGECSAAQISQAIGRSHPNEGATEKQSPSCPQSTEIGTVDVAAGAGPTPFHTQGHAYLAGPYKGAPLSLAVIVPAVAGPFDLGAVVSRVALYVNPDTAQIHAVSDPLPQIIEGIPLDVRSISIEMGRPQFTLNPTSCDPMSIAGTAISALGQSAALANPFQVGGCPQLPFKPKLFLKLKGGTKRTGHPKLIANLKAKPGEANVAEAQVKLPPSAFLDQAHIRTVCTRVQFAANACPAGSIYGTATAVTPLLSDPLSGNVYLRSSSHKLPDLVVALKGPPSLPIEIDLDGKTDSVKGALRNTFEAVPDAPVSSFRLELFGGKKGLVVNSRNLCAHPYKAEVNLTGQNGKVFDAEPVVGTGCKHSGHKRHRGKHR